MDAGDLLRYGEIVELHYGKYKILEQLGHGKNGQAYKVLCLTGINLGCFFALKLFYRLDLEMRRIRFLQEIEFLKVHKHPSIITYFDDGEFACKGKTYPIIVENYMPRTLDQELLEGAISIDKAFTYATQLFSAVRYLQKLNIVHRDIKPANIFVNNNQLILGDFGLIKDLSAHAGILEDGRNFFSNGSMPRFYRTPQLLRYMNHEKNLSLKSDIFQLGLVLSVIFTGINPLKPAKEHDMPIELDKLPSISGEFGAPIMNLIDMMLRFIDDEIPDIDELWSKFDKIYSDFLNSKKDSIY